MEVPEPQSGERRQVGPLSQVEGALPFAVLCLGESALWRNNIFEFLEKMEIPKYGRAFL